MNRTSAVVTIEASGCRLRPISALGVVVDDDLVATVAHAVAGEEEIVVVTADGERRRAVVAAIDTVMDAAVLRVDDLDVEPAGRRAHRAEEDDVAVVVEVDGGLLEQPIEVERQVSVRTTDIYRDGEHVRPGYQLIADVRGGDSGAPVIGADGDVLGLVWARSDERDRRAWALPIAAHEPLLELAATETPVAPAECAR